MIAFPSSPFPGDPLGQRLCEIFGVQRWDFIFAEAPDSPAEKVQWKTEKRYQIKLDRFSTAGKIPIYF